jgi:hypothetical protein
MLGYCLAIQKAMLEFKALISGVAMGSGMGKFPSPQILVMTCLEDTITACNIIKAMYRDCPVDSRALSV